MRGSVSIERKTIVARLMRPKEQDEGSEAPPSKSPLVRRDQGNELPTGGWGVRLNRLLLRLCRLYVAVLVGVWLLLLIGADRWWVGTAVMYGPRWVWGVPLVALIPAAALARRPRLLLSLVAAGIVLVGPVMRLCVPWRLAFGGDARGKPLRVLTCNVDYEDLDAGALGRVIAEADPDVVVLQSWKSRHEKKVFGQPGAQRAWHFHRDGELLLASRFPILGRRVLESSDFPGGPGAAAAYDLQTPLGTVCVSNLHLATPRKALEAVMRLRPTAAAAFHENTSLRRRQSQAASAWAAGTSAAAARVIVAGDFNTPADSGVYRDSWSSFGNAFSEAGFGFGHTHFTRRTSVRIDHVLFGSGWRCRRCWVGPPVGSAHRPVIADLEWVATSP